MRTVQICINNWKFETLVLETILALLAEQKFKSTLQAQAIWKQINFVPLKYFKMLCSDRQTHTTIFIGVNSPTERTTPKS